TERALEDNVALPERLLVKLQRPVHAGAGAEDVRRGKGEDPANVVRRDEVPGRAHHVRPEDLALVKCLLDRRVGCAGSPEADAPFGRGIVLGLHGAEPGDDRFWRFELRTCEPLVQEARGSYVDASHRWGYGRWCGRSTTLTLTLSLRQGEGISCCRPK